MKKTISFIMAIIMAITLIPKISTSVSAMGYNPSTVVNLALSKVGTDYMNGYCLAFVRQMFESAYGYSSTACCAYKYGSRFIDSTSRTNIPLGADVFFGGSSKTCSTCGNKCGHIGIYVGDDYVVHGWSGKIEKFKIDRIINAGYPYRGWGWHNDIALGDVSTNPDDYSIPTRNIYYTSPVMKGNDVGWVQAVLYQCGYNINIDCSFGPSSRDIVKQFQRDNGLSVDGSVGPETREKLRQKWEAKKKSNITLASISVTTYPQKTSYLIGEALDLTGLVLTATYSDGSKKTVTEDYSVSGFDSSSAGTKTITVSFDGKTTTFTVTVKEPVVETYKIVYNANGGTGSMADTVMTVGVAKNLPANTFTRTGYSFLGWSTDKNAAAATYTDKQSVNNLATSGTVTLYAIWQKNPVTSTPTLRIDDTTASVGQTVQIPVYIDNTKIMGGEFEIKFDPAVLKYQSYSDKVFDFAEENADQASSGLLSLVCANASDLLSGKIFILNFEVVADKSCTTTISVSSLEANDGDNPISLKSSEAVVTVSTEKLGDVTGDGKITTQDAIWVLQSIAKKRTLTAAQKSAADVTKDGNITTQDAIWILQSIVGKRTL